jgi:hypothetical protein
MHEVKAVNITSYIHLWSKFIIMGLRSPPPSRNVLVPLLSCRQRTTPSSKKILQWNHLNFLSLKWTNHYHYLHVADYKNCSICTAFTCLLHPLWYMIYDISSARHLSHVNYESSKHILLRRIPLATSAKDLMCIRELLSHALIVFLAPTMTWRSMRVTSVTAFPAVSAIIYVRHRAQRGIHLPFTSSVL